MSNLALNPTAGIFATVKNVLNYIFENMDLFWRVALYYAPYFIGIEIFNLVLNILFGDIADISVFFMIVRVILYVYVFSAFAITWHRLAILGTDSQSFVSPVKLEKSTTLFFMMSFLYAITTIAVMGLSVIGVKIMGLLGVPIFFVVGIVYFWATIRMSFIYPIIALNKTIKFSEIWNASRSYTWAIFATGIIIGIIISIVSIPFEMMANSIIRLGPGDPSRAPGTPVEYVFETLSIFPLLVTILPLSWMSGILTLSNYFKVSKYGTT